MEVAEQMRLERERFILERFSGVEGQKRLNLAKQEVAELQKQLINGRMILAHDDEKIIKVRQRTRGHKNLNLLSKEERADQQLINQELEAQIRELLEKINLQKVANQLRDEEHITGQKILMNSKMQNDEIQEKA